MTPLPPGVLAAAIQTYHLELSMGIEPQVAMERAVASSLAAQDRATRAELAETAAKLAEGLDEDDDDDLFDDGPAALWWFAKAIMDTLPQD